MSDTALAASLAVITVGTTVYTSFCPPFPKVLTAQPDSRSTEQVRKAEVFASLTTLAVGVGLGIASSSKMPVAVAVSVIVAMTAVYEVSLRTVPYV